MHCSPEAHVFVLSTNTSQAPGMVAGTQWELQRINDAMNGLSLVTESKDLDEEDTFTSGKSTAPL